ncbi:NfeD family protein [Planctomycetota bacterium]
MVWIYGLAVFLYLACTALLIAEVFVPSGGLLTVCALGCLAGGITLFFNQSLMVGWIGVGVGAVLIPATLIISYRIFPKTRFGKAVTLIPPDRERGDAIPDTDNLKQLLNQSGQVLTPLRPVGMCDFYGRKVECVAESGYVEPGTQIEVIRVQGTQVTVRVRGDS